MRGVERAAVTAGVVGCSLVFMLGEVQVGGRSGCGEMGVAFGRMDWRRRAELNVGCSRLWWNQLSVPAKRGRAAAVFGNGKCGRRKRDRGGQDRRVERTEPERNGCTCWYGSRREVQRVNGVIRTDWLGSAVWQARWSAVSVAEVIDRG